MLLQDLRYGVRTLRRDTGFFLAAVCIMGLGIGASCTIFSVVNTVLIRPLLFRDPGRLVWIANHEDNGNGGLSGETSQVGHFLDFREHNQSFSDVGAYFAFYGVGDSKLTGHGEPERLTSVPVSQNSFSLLGVKPQLGRLFTADECKWNGPKVVLLSQGLWKRRFASDPSIVGRALTLDDEPVTVVGVLPDLYSPFPMSEETNPWGNTLAIVGRLKPGATVQSAHAESSVLGARIQREHPERNEFVPAVTLLTEHVSGRLRPALFLLASAVGVVMLIVCANLSNLLLARGAARQKEIAIRTALGAGKGRLIRQILTESMLLSCCGAVLGLILAVVGVRFLAHLSAVSIPLLENVRVDASALGFTLLAGVLTGLLFGLVPALQVPSVALSDTLKDANRGSSQGQGHTWIRSALVVSEIALACVLLAGAGLLIRSFLRVLDVDLGFRRGAQADRAQSAHDRIPNSAATGGQGRFAAAVCGFIARWIRVLCADSRVHWNLRRHLLFGEPAAVGNLHSHGAGSFAGHSSAANSWGDVALGVLRCDAWARRCFGPDATGGVAPVRSDPYRSDHLRRCGDVLAGVATLAGYLPAMRAARIEPMTALRAS